MNAETARVVCNLITARVKQRRAYLSELPNTPLQRQLAEEIDALEDAKDEIKRLVK